MARSRVFPGQRRGLLSPGAKWAARISAPVAAAATSAGFFGLAFLAGFRWVLYFGAASLIIAVVLTGVGLIRRPRVSEIDSGDRKGFNQPQTHG